MRHYRRSKIARKYNRKHAFLRLKTANKWILELPLKIKRIPGLVVFCGGILLGVILTCFVVLPKINKQLVNAQTDYGQTLASLTAQRVINASFNNDLVSLQVILQDLVTQPHIVQATIHDVENKLLVQAGELRPLATTHSAYTASIAIHDSISGYITVTLRNFTHHLDIIPKFLIAIALVCILLSSLSLYQTQALEWVTSPSRQMADNAATMLTDVNKNDAADEIEPIYVVVHIKNHDVLKQQLTHETFNATFRKLEKIFRDVFALYNGREFHLQQNYYILSFRNDDATNEAVFRAACSAFLIVELGSIIDKIPLDLAAFISSNKNDLIPAKLPVAGLVMESQSARDELIQSRLNFMDVGTDDGRSIVARFEQPFCHLLENQRKYLSAQLY